MTRTLVAGIGNVFFGDDGFGCEVARRLAARPPRDGVTVTDFGIRGLHLAYELTSGYDAAILVDAVARGGRAGTLYVIDPEVDRAPDAAPPPADGHGVDVAAVLATMRALGAPPSRVVVIGCEVGTLGAGIGLSAELVRAVDPAVALVETLLADGRSAVEEGQP